MEGISALYRVNLLTGKFLAASPDFKQLTGYTVDEVNGIGFKSIVMDIELPGEKESSDPENGAENTCRELYSARYLIKNKSGEELWIEDNALIEYDSKGKAVGSSGILTRSGNKSLSADQSGNIYKKLNVFLNLPDIVIAEVDRDGKIITINNKGLEIIGSDEDEVLGLPLNSVFRGKNSEEEIKSLINGIFADQTESVSAAEISVVTKKGANLFLEWQGYPLSEDKGRVKSAMFIMRDVTRKKIRERVQQNIAQILNAANTESNLNDFFKLIHSTVEDLMPADNFYIALYDRENNLITFPYFVDEVDKTAPPKRLGRGLTELVLRSGRSMLIDKKNDRELVKKGEVDLIGSPAAVWLGIPLKIQDNTIGVLVVQDYNKKETYGEEEKEILEMISFAISRAVERKRLEQERADLIEKLQELNLSKDKLISLISHDLRSPFNSLLGFSEILTTEYDTLTHDEVQEYLKVIYESSKNLYGMTTNLLQFSRFQMGRFDFKPEKILIGEVIDSVMKMLTGNILKKQLNVIVDIEKELTVFADSDMLNSIIQNLFSNAIKFTNKHGDIKIRCIKISDQSGGTFAEISIRDNGVGMSDEMIANIMKGTIYSTPGTDREYGTGLGLLLVKEFVERNNGRLTVTSKENAGSTFTITLPVSK